MKLRDLGEVGVKLLGVYFGLGAIVGFLQLIALRFSPLPEGFPGTGQLALTGLVPVIGEGVAAAACLLSGDKVAARIFPERAVDTGGISRRDLIAVGLALIGLEAVVSGIPVVLRFAGGLIWYAQGSQQANFAAAMERIWTSLLNGVLSVIVGVVLIGMSGRLARRIDGRLE